MFIKYDIKLESYKLNSLFDVDVPLCIDDMRTELFDSHINIPLFHGLAKPFMTIHRVISRF